MTQKEIDERSLKILNHLVQTYIQEGQPVGSKALAERSQLKLSSATIRNIMADLEEAGFLASPHTSAGRIPTEKGYRLFVDQCLTAQSPGVVSIEEFQLEFVSDQERKGLIQKASSLLSKATQLAGVVTLPKREQLLVKQVEFLRLSEKRVLVVLILNDYEVQNRVIDTDRDFSKCELELAGQYLTECFAGRDFLKARRDLIQRMKRERADLEAMLKTIMEMAEESQEKESEYVLAGESNLFNAISSEEYHRLRTLFEAFSEKRDILHLLDRSLEAQGIQIFIGKESGYDLLQDYSLVTAPYSKNGEVVGVLGVIGPTRMPYDRVISAVDITSKLLSRSFEE